MTCRICRYLTISGEGEEHVILRHFLFENWLNIDRLQSYFFANTLTPKELIHVLQNIPRSQLGQIGWSYGRFV